MSIPVTRYLKLHDKRMPRCTTKEQYQAWRETPPTPDVNGFCEDCTSEYQKEMCDKGLCDHPEVLFYLDNEGMIYGSHVASFAKHSIK